MNDKDYIMPVSPLISAVPFKVFTEREPKQKVAFREDIIDCISETKNGATIILKNGMIHPVVESFDEVMKILSNPFYNGQASSYCCTDTESDDIRRNRE